jgi:hypothetical protein
MVITFFFVVYIKITLFCDSFRMDDASFTPLCPDEFVSYFHLQLFASIYPDEEFLPRKSAPVYGDDDSDSAE